MKNSFNNLNIKKSPIYSFQKELICILNYAENNAFLPHEKRKELGIFGILMPCEQIEVCLHDQ